MARLIGPDLAYRAVFLPSGAPAAGRPGVVYGDEAGTALADILTYQSSAPTVPGPAITGSAITCDAYGLLPQFWFPDGANTVWVSVNGGPLIAVGASSDERFDDLAAQVAGKMARGESWISVLDPAYAADRTGAADSRAAIQAAIDAAATFGAVVYVPRGTYKLTVNPTTRQCLRLTAGIRGLWGDGSNATTFKVVNTAGEYHNVIGNFSSAGGYGATAGGIAGILIRDLAIDQNTTNNVVADPSITGPLFNGYPRFCLAVAGGSAVGSVSIVNVAFRDTDGVNTVFFQGRDITLRDLDMCVSASGSDHDHSAIYTSNNSGAGGHCLITGCLIYAPAAGNITARTAIETHGGSQHVSGNTVRAYFKAGNLTGVSTTAGDGIHWIDNDFVGVRYGIQLWSLNVQPAYPPGLRNVHIKHNTFVMDPVSWTPTGATDCRAIFLDTSTTGGNITAMPFVDVWIEGNDIRYLSGHTGDVGDTTCHAIDWRRTAAPGVGNDRNIVIRNNFIDSPIASGIRYTSVAGDYIDGLVISGNRVRNPGQGTAPAGGALPAGYANGIMVVGALRNSRIEDNDLYDDQATHTMNVGLYLAPSYSGGAGNLVSGNRIVGAITSELAFSASFDGGYLVRGDIATWATPTGTVAISSELRALDTGLVYRQTGAPNGSAWTSSTPGLSDGPAGTASLRTLGTGATQAAAGNDSRFSATAPLPTRPKLATSWASLTGRPLGVQGTSTGTLAKDSWRYIPVKLDADWPVDAFSVVTTTAASGGTAALIFGLMALDANGRPSARQADYTSYGSIDLTATAGVLQLATVGLTIPAGEWFLALGWTGTATTSPVLTTVLGIHPAISSSAVLTAMSAYLQAVSGGAVPATAVPSTTATVAPLVHVKLH